MRVRRLAAADYDTWLPVWRAYNDFYRNVPDGAVAEETFRRLHEEGGPLCGFVAEERAALVGLAHAVFHPSTWTAGEYCYLEDLFVTREGRGSGAARSLIEAVYDEADRRGATRVYWHTQAYNAPARSLYDTVGYPTSFVVYER